MQATVTEPSCLWTRAIWPGTPGWRSAEPPNQCGTLAAGPSLHLRMVPTFASAMVVVPETVIGPETALPVARAAGREAADDRQQSHETAARQPASSQFPTIGSGMNSRTS